MMFEEFLYYERKKAADEAAEKALLRSKVETILDFLQDLGPVPEELQECLEKEQSPEKLRSWCKLAGKAHSIEEFQIQIGATL